MRVINVDTDMIIPKQYLKTIKRTGLGTALFSEMRYIENGKENPDFVLNKPAYRKANILVAGDNFGCGSSREHAPWALTDLGLRAIVSSEIADIFRNNSLKNGLLPIVLDEATVQSLMQRPDDALTVDIDARELRTPAGDVHPFPLDAFARTCLMEGVDELGYLLLRSEQISRFESDNAAISY